MNRSTRELGLWFANRRHPPTSTAETALEVSGWSRQWGPIVLCPALLGRQGPALVGIRVALRLKWTARRSMEMEVGMVTQAALGIAAACEWLKIFFFFCRIIMHVVSWVCKRLHCSLSLTDSVVRQMAGAMRRSEHGHRSRRSRRSSGLSGLKSHCSLRGGTSAPGSRFLATSTCCPPFTPIQTCSPLPK